MRSYSRIVMFIVAALAGYVAFAEDMAKPATTATAPATAAANSVTFYGIPAKPTKIVYILDHSGSMLDTFDFLRQEAIRSVDKMLPETSFSVIMVSEKASVMFDELQKATPEVKKDFAKKMSAYRAQGMNDDFLAPFQEAFEKAFAMEPDTIHFLTDGHFDLRLRGVVTKLNKDQTVRVNTLAFVNHDPSYEEQLKDLAKDNIGKYKFVTEKDFGR